MIIPISKFKPVLVIRLENCEKYILLATLKVKGSLFSDCCLKDAAITVSLHFSAVFNLLSSENKVFALSLLFIG